MLRHSVVFSMLFLFIIFLYRSSTCASFRRAVSCKLTDIRHDSPCSVHQHPYNNNINISFHTRDGFYMMTYGSGDLISDYSPTGPHFFEQGLVDSVISALRTAKTRHAKRSSEVVFLDVGANLGIFSLAAARAGFRVLSVEAFPSTAARLQCSKSLNSFDNMMVYNRAVGRKAGKKLCFNVHAPKGDGVVVNMGATATVEVESNVSTCGQNGKPVKIITLDGMFDGPWSGINGPTVMKMDCEGCEMDALLGYAKWFAYHLPEVIVLELQPKTLKPFGSNTTDVASWIMAYGYRLYLGGNEVTVGQVRGARKELCGLCNGLFIRSDLTDLYLKDM